MSEHDVRELMAVDALVASLDAPGECENCDLIRRMAREYRELLEGAVAHYVV